MLHCSWCDHGVIGLSRMRKVFRICHSYRFGSILPLTTTERSLHFPPTMAKD